MKVSIVSMVLVCSLVAVGCARKDFPVSRYEIDQPMQRFAACVYRDAQRKVDPAETVHQTRLDDPEEVQVTKHAVYGVMVWEVDTTQGLRMKSRFGFAQSFVATRPGA